jgi:putative transposase
MTYDPNKYHRRSIRLKGYDYTSPGAYFVTICVHDRECVLGQVVDDEMELSEWGQIAAESWDWLGERYPYVTVDAWVVMPNHTHAIIVIHDDDCGGGSRTAPTGTGPTVTGDVGEGGSRTAPTGAGPAGMGDVGGGGSRTAPTGTGPTGTGDVGEGGSRTVPTGTGHTGAGHAGGAVRRRPLGRLVGAFKTVSTKRINLQRDTPGARFWQRNYWEHVVRDEASYQRIYRYVRHNPASWEDDQLHPDAPPNPFNRG